MTAGLVQRRIATALIAALGLALVLFGWAASRYADVLDAHRWSLHTYEVLLNVEQLNANLDDDRGLAMCALTGDRRNLPTMDRQANFRATIGRLEALVADNPAQSQRLQRLETQWQRFIDGYVEPLRAWCDLPPDASRPSLAEVEAQLARGAELRPPVRAELTALSATERELLDVRRRSTRSLQSGTGLALFAATTFAVAFLVASVLAARRAARRLQESVEALQRESEQRQLAVAGHAASEQALRSVFQHIPEAIAIVGDDGRIEGSNRTGGLLGWHAGGAPAEALRLPADGDDDADADVVYLHPVARPDGEPAMHEFSRVPMPSPQQRRYLFVARNVEERQRLERAKAQFLSTVSHELRTPLTSLRAALAIVADDDYAGIDGDAAEMVRLAHLNAENLARLVNDIVDLGQLGSARMDFALQAVPLEAAIAGAAELAQSIAWVRDVTIRWQPPAVGAAVRADPQRLGQVLANLLNNAVKFSPAGAEVRLQAEVGDHVARIDVIDAGPGIPAAFAERIFQPFARADDSDSRRQGGTGLGLSISRAMIQHMHGRIGYENLAGGGCRFWVELPLARDDDAEN